MKLYYRALISFILTALKPRSIYPNKNENWFLPASPTVAFKPACIAQLVQVVLLRRRQAWLKFEVAPWHIPNFQFHLGIYPNKNENWFLPASPTCLGIRKKRPFALLEVMIGLSLLISLNVYLIRGPFSSLKKELNILYQIEADRLWEAKIVEIGASLRERCATLPTSLSEATFSQTLIPLSFSQELQAPTIIKEYRLYVNKKGTNYEGNPCFLVALQLKKDKKPSYQFFIP